MIATFSFVWCARYLEQIKFLRWILRAQNSRATNDMMPSLTHEARERIAKALKSTGSKVL